MKFFKALLVFIIVYFTTAIEKKKKKFRKVSKLKKMRRDDQSSSSMQLPGANLTNVTPLIQQYSGLMNNTYRPLDSVDVFKSFQTWDYKMLPNEIQDIFQYMLFKQEGRVTQTSLRVFFALFVQKFKKCDLDGSNTLIYSEWVGCLKNDTDFAYIKPPLTNRTAFNPTVTTAVGFYATLFELLDVDKRSELNFNEYMKFRLYVFSWRYCSVFAPYILEAEFECALPIATKLEPGSRTKIRNLYNFWVRQAGNQSLKNFDFSLFIIVMHSARLYAQINNKKDSDITLKEFEMALDTGVLPRRYNQDTISYLFKLIESKNNHNDGFDLLTFTYYDYYLILFDSFGISRPYYLNYNEFSNLLTSMYFPNNTLTQILLTPQYNMSANSYNTYLFANITNFNSEADFFYKFSQVEGKDQSKLQSEKSHLKTKLKTRSRSNTKQLFGDAPNLRVDGSSYHRFDRIYNITFNQNVTIQKFFDLVDTRQNGYVNFYDFATLVQLGYLYTHVDLQLAGTVTAGRLLEFVNSYPGDIPVIGRHITDRAFRLSEFNENLNIDFYSFSTIMKLEDMVMFYFRETYQTLIYEVEMRKILNRTNMRYLNANTLNQCLRGVDYKNVPLYDWECAFKFGINQNLNYYQVMNDRQAVKMNNITLDNTAYYLIDPNYA